MSYVIYSHVILLYHGGNKDKEKNSEKRQLTGNRSFNSLKSYELNTVSK